MKDKALTCEGKGLFHIVRLWSAYVLSVAGTVRNIIAYLNLWQIVTVWDKKSPYWVKTVGAFKTVAGIASLLRVRGHEPPLINGGIPSARVGILFQSTDNLLWFHFLEIPTANAPWAFASPLFAILKRRFLNVLIIHNNALLCIVIALQRVFISTLFTLLWHFQSLFYVPNFTHYSGRIESNLIDYNENYCHFWEFYRL